MKMIMNKLVELNKKAKEPITGPELIKMCIGYGLLLLAIIFIFGHVIMLNIIPSGSMEGTIETGDVVIATRYDKEDVDRYDIMVFIPPDEPDKYYIKRVIGLPGETIVVHDGEVYADGIRLDSSFVPEKMGTSGDGVYVVPEGCYFMMGDNRNHSLDARYWKNKFVPAENMVAKARVTVFPFRNIGSLAYAAEDTGTDEHTHVWINRTVYHDALGHVETREGANVWIIDVAGWSETVTVCAVCGAGR